MASSESRFAVSLAVSLALNAIVWTAAGGALLYRVAKPLTPIEIERVIVDKKGHTTVKVVKPKEIEKKVKKIVERKPLPPPKIRPTTPPPKPPPPPEGAHNHVITAPVRTDASKPADFTAPADGNAKLGAPTDAQAPGNAVVNPPEPPKVDSPKADPPKPAPPEPAKVDPPKIDPPKGAPPEPAKVYPPKPKGPTRDAEPVDAITPTIPGSIDTSNIKSFVRAKVRVAADGSFDVVLRTSSNNADLDKILLETLKKWKWKPALVDGEPVESTKLFKFEFEIK